MEARAKTHQTVTLYHVTQVGHKGVNPFTCHEANLKPTYCPFWERFPFTNIFHSITPDVLHQLQQGISKYLIWWLIKLWSEEIDVRCSRLPPNHNAWHFYKGITTLSNLTGQEHKDISRIILGLVVDLPLPENRSTVCLIRAVRALLDFFYLSQYSVHSTESLDTLEDALRRFHENKDIFIELGIQQHFNLPKLLRTQQQCSVALLELLPQHLNRVGTLASLI